MGSWPSNEGFRTCVSVVHVPVVRFVRQNVPQRVAPGRVVVQSPVLFGELRRFQGGPVPVKVGARRVDVLDDVRVRVHGGFFQIAHKSVTGSNRLGFTG